MEILTIYGNDEWACRVAAQAIPTCLFAFSAVNDLLSARDTRARGIAPLLCELYVLGG